MGEIIHGGSGVSRRGFLKGVGLAGLALGATAGLAGCSSVTPAGSMFAAPGVKKTGYQYASEIPEGTWHHCACQRNCFDTCMMKVRTVGGRVVEVRGDENSPYTAGGLCVKTQSYVDWCYREDRIMYPLRRTGKKGPGCTFVKDGKVPDDHVAYELELMATLAGREADAVEAGRSVAVLEQQRLQREFLVVHLGGWLGLFAARIAEAPCAGFYGALARFACDFATEDDAALGASIRELENLSGSVSLNEATPLVETA